MRKNEITLQEMFSTIVEELRESGRWGTAHIYQASSNAFSAFTNYQALPLRKLSPTVLKRFENHLRQRNCSWNTVSTYIKTIRSTYNRAVDMKCVRYTPRLFEHVYTGTRPIGRRLWKHRISAIWYAKRKWGCRKSHFPITCRKPGYSLYSCSCCEAFRSSIWPICTRGICKAIHYRTAAEKRDAP